MNKKRKKNKQINQGKTGRSIGLAAAAAALWQRYDVTTVCDEYLLDTVFKMLSSWSCRLRRSLLHVGTGQSNPHHGQMSNKQRLTNAGGSGGRGRWWC